MSEQSNDLAAQVGERLKAAGLTLATAESCTGGLVGDRLTNIPGSSEYYLGGVVSYDNKVKEGVLKVPGAVLATVGAVSQECALAMAQGVRGLIGTNLAVSTTGIAGPGGGSPEKPVGLVYIALVDDKGYTRCERYVWPGDRLENKATSAQAALQLVLDYLNRPA